MDHREVILFILTEIDDRTFRHMEIDITHQVDRSREPVSPGNQYRPSAIGVRGFNRPVYGFGDLHTITCRDFLSAEVPDIECLIRKGGPLQFGHLKRRLDGSDCLRHF